MPSFPKSRYVLQRRLDLDARRKLPDWVTQRISRIEQPFATRLPLSTRFIRFKLLAHSQISTKLIPFYLLGVYASIYLEKRGDLLRNATTQRDHGRFAFFVLGWKLFHVSRIWFLGFSQREITTHIVINFTSNHRS